MDLVATVSEVIDFRSFSSLWYWIAVAALWSAAGNRVLGVPWDLVRQARRGSAAAAGDAAQLVRIHCRRQLGLARASGLWIVGIVAWLLTSLALLGFGYGIELAQAVLAMALPMTLAGALNLRAAARVEAAAPEGAALAALLVRQRRRLQALGALSIFLTALWGMYVNLTAPII